MTVGPDQLARLLLVGVREHGVELDEAARLLGCPVADVPRVLQRVFVDREVGIPPLAPEDVAFVVVENGLVKVETPDELAGWPVTTLDVATLTSTLRAVAPGLPAPLRARADALIERLRAAAHPDAREVAAARATTLGWEVADVDPAVAEVVWPAAQGRERVVLQVYNASRDELQARDALALRVVQSGEAWYLAAADPGDRRIRWWRLDRIVRAERTGEVHDVPDPPDSVFRRDRLYDPPAEHLEVRVRFEPDVLARAEAWFGRAPHGAEDPHVLRIQTPTLPVVLRRLFEFGSGWEVLEPPAARTLVTTWARRLLGDAAQA